MNAEHPPADAHSGPTAIMVNSSSPMPLLSIVTVVRNGERDIEATLSSICSFHAPDVEIVVVDGQSTDSTMAIARRFADRIDVLVSEPDSGIYDAMNKGIALAHGRFVVHINVGDQLLRVPLSELAAAAPDVAAVSFPVQYVDGHVFVPRIDWRLKMANSLHHQGTFYRRTPALRYDLTFRTFADFDLNQRLLHPGNVLCLPGPVSRHSADGVSHQRSRFGEVYDIIRRNQGEVWVVGAWILFKARGLRWRLKNLFRS